ncbi:TPA: N-acetylmuramoyl-L-alanine amidase, partial [Clostridium perfringens]
MKIAVRGGHNFQAKGASALIDETIEDRKVKDSVILNLRKEGHEVLDVTPGNCDVNTDLRYGVNKAEEWG